jgi:hypothetical protein
LYDVVLMAILSLVGRHLSKAIGCEDALARVIVKAYCDDEDIQSALKLRNARLWNF